MELNFSQEERQVQLAARDFAKRALSVDTLDRLDHVSRDLVKKMGDLDFFSLKIPEKSGGETASWVSFGILTEEIAKANATIANLIMLSNEISFSVSMCGTEEAKEEWLFDIAKGEKLGCISVTEPDCGSDVAAIKTRAVKDKDFYIISGEKGPVSFGMQADIAMLFAKTDMQAGARGITAFLVPMDLPGITKAPIKNMGLFPSNPVMFTLSEVCVPAEYRLGREGEGFNINASLGLFSDLGRVLTGLICLGLSQTALELAILYSKKRVAFGRPIGQFEAISGKIAEHATLIEAGRWLCYRALWLKDQDLPVAKEAAMCGWWCPKLAARVLEDALLIHGHSGYAVDLPFQQMLRDVIAFEIMSGTEQILKLKIAQEVMGRVGVPDNFAAGTGY